MGGRYGGDIDGRRRKTQHTPSRDWWLRAAGLNRDDRKPRPRPSPTAALGSIIVATYGAYLLSLAGLLML